MKGISNQSLLCQNNFVKALPRA